MSDKNLANQYNDQLDDEFKIDFLEWMISLGEEKATILLTFSLITLASIVYSLIITPTFVAKSTIMVSAPTTTPVNTAGLALIGTGISGIMGGFRSQEETHIAFLNSDLLIDSVINKLKLHNASKKLIDIRDELRGVVKIYIDKKSNFIVIEAENSDPGIAAEIVNTYVHELTKLIGEFSINAAQQKLLFYQKAIAKTQTDLLEAKSKFRDTNEQSPVLSTASLAENTFIQIQNKELQLNAMSHYSTKLNPDIQRLEVELSALRSQLYKTNRNPSNSTKADIKETLALDTYRDIKSLENILSTLSSQYKAAAMETYSTNYSSIQQIDKAVPPERRSKPQRTKIVQISSIIGLLIGVLLGLIRIKMKKMKLDNEFIVKIKRLKLTWFNYN